MQESEKTLWSTRQQRGKMPLTENIIMTSRANVEEGEDETGEKGEEEVDETSSKKWLEWESDVKEEPSLFLSSPSSAVVLVGVPP